jgi:hypothetical protein
MSAARVIPLYCDDCSNTGNRLDDVDDLVPTYVLCHCGRRPKERLVTLNERTRRNAALSRANSRRQLHEVEIAAAVGIALFVGAVFALVAGGRP